VRNGLLRTRLGASALLDAPYSPELNECGRVRLSEALSTAKPALEKRKTAIRIRIRCLINQ